MAQSIFSLFGEVFVNTDKADSSLSKTEDKAGSVANKLGTGIKTAAKWGTAIVGGATAAAGAMVSFSNKVADQADEIDKMSQKLGMSREAYQEWDYVLGQAGVDINSMQTGMKTLMNQIGKAQGGSEDAAASFAQLGISMDDINTMSREDIFAKVVEGMQGLEDSTNRAALANTLFGKSGQNLTPLFNETAASTEELKNNARELGLVLGDDVIDSGVKLHDTMDTLKKSFESIGAGLGSALIPIVDDMAQEIIDFLPILKEIISEIAPVLGDLLKTILPPLMDLAKEIIPVLLDVIKPIIPLLSELLKIILPPLTEVIKVLAKVISVVLGSAIDALMPVLEGFETYLGGLIKFIKGVFTGDWKQAWEGITDMFEGIVSGWGALIKAPLNEVIGLINRAFASIGSINIPSWVPKIGGQTFSLPQIPLLANGGTITASGSAIVGEAGAELIEMPAGARVTPLDANGDFNAKLDSIVSMMAQFMPLIGQGQVVLDTGATVGALAPKMDAELGRRATMRGRFV